MTIEEAQIHFKYNDLHDLDDQFESQLFEYKQFFTSKPPVRKVFQAKLKKLDQMHLAYQILGGKLELSTYNPLIINFDKDLVTAFQSYYKVRGELKQRIMQASDVADLRKMILHLLTETKLYASVWQFNHEDYDGILVSSESDEMLIYKELCEFESENPVTIEAINKLDCENVLVRESKRLSLWLKLDQDV